MSYIPIKLDKTRNLLFGFGAMKMFKSIHGKSLMKIDFESEDVEDIIPLMVYVGLKHEDNELTLEQTVELLDKHLGVKRVMELMPKIMHELGMGEEGDKPSKNV